MYSTSVTVVILSLAKVHEMHAKVHLLIARSCRLPRCNSLDDKIKLNGMHRCIVHIL